ncbi:hypothetical protein [Novosphingobium sp.]|uniref:hypothetical protein n=1 Tax=Novosphingobium sp. TaxID=1874826 RepID=UPI001DFE9AC6|nr:hypothetical protein [Novosphingobium sp.]MBX9665043.1 hypothetical protein [Novosphingobium sp.]
MTTLYYSRAKLITSGAFLLILAPVLGLFSLFAGPIGMIVGVILIVGGPLASIGRLGRVFSDLKAIEYDERQIHLHPLGASRRLNWREVTGIEVHTLTQYIYGFIPVNRQHSIRITHSGGVLGKAKITIPFNLLAMDKATVIARLADMEKLRGGDGFVGGAARVSKAALTQAMNAPREAPREVEEPVSDFDADAVMARYMARREAEAAAVTRAEEAARPQMPPRVAGFGRKRA